MVGENLNNFIFTLLKLTLPSVQRIISYWHTVLGLELVVERSSAIFFALFLLPRGLPLPLFFGGCGWTEE